MAVAVEWSAGVDADGDVACAVGRMQHANSSVNVPREAAWVKVTVKAESGDTGMPAS